MKLTFPSAALVVAMAMSASCAQAHAHLVKADGAAVAVTSKVDGKAIDGALAAPLAAGGYMVMWHVAPADGHKMKGQYNFTVR